MAQVHLPYDFKPRHYQLPVYRALDNGIKRVFWFAHRRSGKDLAVWNWIIKHAALHPGIYYYILPTYTQAKKVIWEGTTNDGRRFLDYIPQEVLAKKPNDSELKVEIKNLLDPSKPGSIIRLIGSENYDSIRGTNPVCCVFSEYAYQDPRAWEVVRPILKLNGGIAIFITTPNGDNHAAEMFSMAVDNPDWFADLLSIKDTGLLTDADLDSERKEGTPEEMIQQEYYCSTDIGMPGSIYGPLLKEVELTQRITTGLYDSSQLVYTAWDIGFSDNTVAIFYQKEGKQIKIIDVLDGRQKPTDYYISELKTRPYRYAYHYLPHDALHKNQHTGRSTFELFMEAGLSAKPTMKFSVQEGIQATRKLFARFFFDKDKCQNLLLAIKNYHREFDHVKKQFKKDPEHNWASDWADALRYLSVSFEEDKVDNQKPKNYGYKIKK